MSVRTPASPLLPFSAAPLLRCSPPPFPPVLHPCLSAGAWWGGGLEKSVTALLWALVSLSVWCPSGTDGLHRPVAWIFPALPIALWREPEPNSRPL